MANLEQALNTLTANEESLFENPNVTFVGVVPGNEDPRPGATPSQDSDDFQIVVGLAHAIPEVEDVSEDDADLNAQLGDYDWGVIPNELRINDENGEKIDGSVVVQTEVTGEITMHSYTDRRRPVRGGNSCGNPRQNSAGTLGAAVLYRGKVHILSNWHVLYGAGGRDGDLIVQPGRLDGGRVPRDVIATNTSGWLDTYRDAAIARVRDPWKRYVAGGTRCYGLFGKPKVATVLMAVQKCGRTTKATTGTIRSINSSVRVNGYPSGPRVFRDQIITTAMSRAGDSGSLVCERGSNSPVGLLFAGSSSVSVANKFQRIVGQSLEKGEKEEDFLKDLEFNLEG